MKIVAGKFGGRRLCTPQNKSIRPTSDKIRGALFNMLESRGALAGVHVLDAFCGTGALGIEALSRGAERCTFVDKARDSLVLARKNVDMLGLSGISEFILRDVTKIGGMIGSEAPYTLIFLDPPYHQGLVPVVGAALIQAGFVADGGWLVCEVEKSVDNLGIEKCILDVEKTYGDTKIYLFQYDDHAIVPE